MTARTDAPQPNAQADDDIAGDRRRPGRSNDVNPELVPLLRGQVEVDLPPDTNPDLPQARRTARVVDREVVTGVAVAAGLILLGAALRFAV